MTHDQVSLHEYLEEASKLKLTKPQQAIFDLLKRGYRFKIINTHYRNGGSIIWITPWGNEMHAGHVYRALQGIGYKLQKVFGQYPNCPDLWVK